MGMYDTIFVKIKCPFCKEESLMDCQTKSLDCDLNEYHVGDKCDTKFNSLFCITECKSKKCYYCPNPKGLTLSEYGSKIKHTYFDVKITLENGIITGKYEIVESL